MEAEGLVNGRLVFSINFMTEDVVFRSIKKPGQAEIRDVFVVIMQCLLTFAA